MSDSYTEKELVVLYNKIIQKYKLRPNWKKQLLNNIDRAISNKDKFTFHTMGIGVFNYDDSIPKSNTPNIIVPYKYLEDFKKYVEDEKYEILYN